MAALAFMISELEALDAEFGAKFVTHRRRFFFGLMRRFPAVRASLIFPDRHAVYVERRQPHDDAGGVEIAEFPLPPRQRIGI